MRWADVTPDILGTPVPQLALAGVPSDVKVTVDGVTDMNEWTVDKVEAICRDPSADARQVFQAMIGPDKYIDILKALDNLDVKADSPAMARTMRRLTVPEAVTLSYVGATAEGNSTLTPERNNEFTTKIEGLKETVPPDQIGGRP